MMFSTRAWCPAERRTLAASNIVMEAKPTASITTGLFQPKASPKETNNPQTIDEWALGMPPVLTKYWKSMRLVLINPVVILIVWAITQLKNADQNHGVVHKFNGLGSTITLQPAFAYNFGFKRA